MFKPGESPANRFLGTSIELTESGHVVLQAPIQSEFVQETGVVQGGILSAIADQAAGLCALTVLAEGETTAGIEFKVNFLAPARFPGTLRAEARIKKRGGKISVVECSVHSGEHMVLTGLFTFLNWMPGKK